MYRISSRSIILRALLCALVLLLTLAPITGAAAATAEVETEDASSDVSATEAPQVQDSTPAAAALAQSEAAAAETTEEVEQQAEVTATAETDATVAATQADQDGPYTSDPDADPTPSGNGTGKTPHDAGSKGNADDKNPPGQMPGPDDDGDVGYECDGNSGVSKGNPAHTQCPEPPPPPPPAPGITIVKTHTLSPLVDPQNIPAGGTATWFIRVANSGNVPLTDVTVTDPLASGCNRNLGAMAVGASTEYACSLGGVAQGFTNRADVEGTTPSNTKVTASDTAPVTVFTTTGGGSPSIQLIKTAPTPACPRPGQDLTYRFEIRNTGNQTLTNVALNDPLLGGAVALPNTTLNAGQSMVATKAYKLTGANLKAGQVQNTATVTSAAPSGGTVSNTAQAVVMLEDCPGQILLEKDGPATAAVGEQITYTFTVTNTGEVPLSNVRLTDQRLHIFGLPVNPINLAPGQQGTATATYTVTEADAEATEILNIAFVRARTPDDSEVEDDDDHLVPVPPVREAPDPAIRLEKDGPATASVGESVTYRFTVTNTGDTTLLNVNITDPLLGLDRLRVRPSTLRPDEQGTATATYVITAADAEAGSVYNTAVARGRAPDGRTVRDPDDHTVEVPGPPACPSPPCGPPPPPELPATGLGTTGFAVTGLLSLALGGVLLGVAGSGNLQAAMASSTVNADSPVLAMLRQWNLAPKPGGSQARRRRRR